MFVLEIVEYNTVIDTKLHECNRLENEHKVGGDTLMQVVNIGGFCFVQAQILKKNHK